MSALTGRYLEDGYLSGVPILTADEAATHRRRLEEAEATLGPLHYLDKISTLLPSPYELATHPAVLDVVERCIGPDILLYNATYIIKEPGTEAHVAWHQDLTYWGLADDDAQVSMWLALAPATEQSGCMQFVPGSHKHGKVAHVLGGAEPESKTNVLLQDQRIDDTTLETVLDPSTARFAELEAGEASFHHGWTVHASPPNRSNDRRIGLNVQYLAPHNRTMGAEGLTAVLARGTDGHGHFEPDPTPTELSEATVTTWRELDARMKAGFQIDPER